MIINWDSDENLLEKIQTIYVFKKDRLYFVSYRTIPSGVSEIDRTDHFFELYVVPDKDCDLTEIEMEINEMMNDKQDDSFSWCNVQIQAWKHIDVPKKFINEIKETK